MVEPSIKPRDQLIHAPVKMCDSGGRDISQIVLAPSGRQAYTQLSEIKFLNIFVDGCRALPLVLKASQTRLKQSIAKHKTHIAIANLSSGLPFRVGVDA